MFGQYYMYIKISRVIGPRNKLIICQEIKIMTKMNFEQEFCNSKGDNPRHELSFNAIYFT